MKYREALNLVNKKSEDFFKTGSVHGYAVHIIEESGSVLFLESAIAELVEDWWFIYSEHNGNFVFHAEDASVYTYKRVWLERFGTKE